MKRTYFAGQPTKYQLAQSAREIQKAVEELGEISHKEILNRNRPYNGQPHTDDGARGQQEVFGVTMRDIRDCFILALYDANPHQEAPESLHDLDVGNMDMEAVGQNLVCRIEQYMGIFPNLPRGQNG